MRDQSSSASTVASGRSSTKASGVSPHFRSGCATTAQTSDRRVAVEHVLDLERGDVLAAGDDDVLAAVLDLDVAVGLHHREVAGVEPAAAERLLGRRAVLEVALHRDIAAEHDLAHGLAVGRRPPWSPGRAPSSPSSST